MNAAIKTPVDDSRLMRSAIVCEVATVAAPPSEILICPWGRIESKAGVFAMDAEAAALVVAAFNRHGVDLVIDWEHQTVEGYNDRKDRKSPAAGWIKSMHARPGVGLFGKVQWTPDGADDITHRRYRYLSPVVLASKTTGRVNEIHSVALTNKPAIPAMRPVVNSAAKRKDTTVMDQYDALLQKLRDLAGLDASADEAAVLDALGQSLKPVPMGTVNSVTLDDGRVVVPMSDHTAVARRMEAAETELLQVHEDRFITNAVNSGKVTAHSAPRWRELFRKDRAMAQGMIDDAPVVAPPAGRTVNATGRGATTNRQSIVNASRVEYDATPGIHKLTTRVEFVNQELRAMGMAPLAADEVKTFGV